MVSSDSHRSSQVNLPPPPPAAAFSLLQSEDVSTIRVKVTTWTHLDSAGLS